MAPPQMPALGTSPHAEEPKLAMEPLLPVASAFPAAQDAPQPAQQPLVMAPLDRPTPTVPVGAGMPMDATKLVMAPPDEPAPAAPVPTAAQQSLAQPILPPAVVPQLPRPLPATRTSLPLFVAPPHQNVEQPLAPLATPVQAVKQPQAPLAAPQQAPVASPNPPAQLSASDARAGEKEPLPSLSRVEDMYHE